MNTNIEKNRYLLLKQSCMNFAMCKGKIEGFSGYYYVNCPTLYRHKNMLVDPIHMGRKRNTSIPVRTRQSSKYMLKYFSCP